MFKKTNLSELEEKLLSKIQKMINEDAWKICQHKGVIHICEDFGWKSKRSIRTGSYSYFNTQNTCLKIHEFNTWISEVGWVDTSKAFFKKVEKLIKPWKIKYDIGQKILEEQLQKKLQLQKDKQIEDFLNKDIKITNTNDVYEEF